MSGPWSSSSNWRRKDENPCSCSESIWTQSKAVPMGPHPIAPASKGVAKDRSIYRVEFYELYSRYPFHSVFSLYLLLNIPGPWYCFNDRISHYIWCWVFCLCNGLVWWAKRIQRAFQPSLFTLLMCFLPFCAIYSTLMLYMLPHLCYTSSSFFLNIMGDVYAFSLFLFINSYLFMGNVCPFPYLSWTSLPEQDKCVLCPTLRMLQGIAERVK